MKIPRTVIVVAVAAVVAIAAALVTRDSAGGGTRQSEAGTLKVGVVSILEGAFAGLGEQGTWGVKTALTEFGGKLAGKGARDTVINARAGGLKIQLYIESSDGSPDKALEATRRLIEQKKVDVFVGPLSGAEGLAVKEYAKKHLDKTFISGAASSQDLTLRKPAPNYFRFSPDAVQMAAGLGSYAYKTMGVHKVAAIGEDYAFPYDQVGAFVVDFCRAGGDVVQRTWVPIGTTDYSSFIARIPSDADGVLALLSGTDALDFIKALHQFGRNNLKVIGGSVTVDPTIIRALGQQTEGVVSGSPVAVLNTASYKKYAAELKRLFPQSAGPGLNDVFYYTATKSLLLALNKIHGNLGSSQQNLKRALAALRWMTPVGPTRLDDNRQAIVNTYITKVIGGENRVVKTNKNVNETLGVPRAQYLKLGAFSRTNPPCSH